MCHVGDGRDVCHVGDGGDVGNGCSGRGQSFRVPFPFSQMSTGFPMTQKCCRPGGTVQQWAMSPNQCVNRTVFFFEKKTSSWGDVRGAFKYYLEDFFLLGGPA